MEQQELKIRIIEAAMRAFNQKGLKFTMDDIAKDLSISKKTIYTVYSDKESLFLSIIEYGFGRIKDSEARVIQDDSLSTLEKIRKILGVLPEGYQELNLSKMYELKDRYPAIYAEVEKRLETGWEVTLELLEQGMKEGVIRPVKLILVKTMLEATLEQFFQRDVLVQNEISYYQALTDVVDIIVDGIANNNKQ